MEGIGEVPIQNSFVALPAPYPLSSCRGDPGEPYHSSICKCTCTWTTAWACWDCKLIYANLGETVTTQSRPPTPVVISPRQHNSQRQALKMCRKFQIMGGAVSERKKTIELVSKWNVRQCAVAFSGICKCKARCLRLQAGSICAINKQSQSTTLNFFYLEAAL